MVHYDCNRCGYSTEYRTSFLKHLNRKYPCKCTLDNISINEMKALNCFEFQNEMEDKIDESAFSHHLVTPKSPQSQHLVSPKSAFSCPFCKTEYAHKQSLHRHIKQSCKLNNLENEKEVNQSNHLVIKSNHLVIKSNHFINKSKYIKKQVFCKFCKKGFSCKQNVSRHEQHYCKQKQVSLVNTINNNNNNNTNSNNTINNNNNIIINNFEKENIDYISRTFLTKLLNTPLTAIPKLLKEIHFNEKFPENNNIRILNKKLKYIDVHNKNKWECRNKKEVLNNLAEKGYDIIDENYEGIYKEDKIIKNYNKFQNNFNNEKIKKKIDKKI